MTVTVHTNGDHLSHGERSFLTCCGRRLYDVATPAIVTTDPALVTCKGNGPFVEHFHEAAFVGETIQYYDGTFVRFEGGTLDLGIVRDFAYGFGERWRPWKRHLRWFPPLVRRWFGWRSFDADPFIEELP